MGGRREGGNGIQKDAVTRRWKADLRNANRAERRRTILKFTRELLRWYMPATYAATIFMVSSLQGPPPGMAIPASDKVLHMAAFGLMAVFVALAVQRPGRPFTWKGALLAIVITSVYGALDEVHQSMVSGRFASVDDALADAAGAVLAVGWYYLIARKHPCFSLVMGSQAQGKAQTVRRSRRPAEEAAEELIS